LHGSEAERPALPVVPNDKLYGPVAQAAMAIVEEGLGQWLNPSSLPAPPQPPVPPQQKYRPPLAGNMYRDLE